MIIPLFVLTAGVFVLTAINTKERKKLEVRVTELENKTE